MKHVLISLFLALTAYAQAQERVAIINTMDDYDSISVADLTYLTDRLRETAVNVLPSDRFGVMTTESIVAFLGSFENTVKVCKESSCLAELGKKVSADYVAQGRIGRFGENLTIKVELYNVKTGNLIGSFTGNFKDIYSSLTLIDEKATDLFRKILAEPKAQKPEVAPPTAPQPVADSAAIARIQTLIEKGIEKNKVKIQKESIYLSNSDKMALYKGNRKESALGYAALNFLPGFGLGSYMQGDIIWGAVQSVSDVVGWSLIYSYGVTWSVDRIGSYSCPSDRFPTCEDMDKQIKKENKDKIKVIITNISLSLIFLSRGLGIMCPFYYNKTYNKTLREALDFHDKVSYSIEPLIVPRDGTPAVGLAFNVRY